MHKTNGTQLYAHMHTGKVLRVQKGKKDGFEGRFRWCYRRKYVTTAEQHNTAYPRIQPRLTKLITLHLLLLIYRMGEFLKYLSGTCRRHKIQRSTKNNWCIKKMETCIDRYACKLWSMQIMKYVSKTSLSKRLSKMASYDLFHVTSR